MLPVYHNPVHLISYNSLCFSFNAQKVSRNAFSTTYLSVKGHIRLLLFQSSKIVLHLSMNHLLWDALIGIIGHHVHNLASRKRRNR